MEIECPNCKKQIDVTDKLPHLACDNEEHECECGCRFEFGWYATAEVRSILN